MSSRELPPGSGAAIDPSKLRPKPSIPIPAFADRAAAARYWAHYGFTVLPLVPGEKSPAVKWDPWLERYGIETIAAHWSEHPDHDVGCIVGDQVLVLDVDSPEAEQAALEIEARFGIRPRFIVKTKRGTHRYYQLAAGTFAKPDSHSTILFKAGIDVKTGRSCVTLPPSGGRSILLLEAASVFELSIVGQDFVDAVFIHNGRPVPRPHPSVASTQDREHAGGAALPQLHALLEHITSDLGYDDWLRVLAAIWHATNGSDAGLDLADEWSSKGSTYKGRLEIEAKWRSFREGVAKPATVATLVKLARDAGADVATILGHTEDFAPADYAVVTSDAPVKPEVAHTGHPLEKYSLRGRLEEVERQRVEQKAFLGEIALLGQATVIYAKPNTGKTLIVLFLIIEAIKRGLVDPASVVYINMDDNSTGLVEKLRIAEEFGFHMVADGHLGFEAKAFAEAMIEMIRTDRVNGAIVVLDTLKKFVNTMDKTKSSNFAKIARQFVMKGGTLIALSHANKHPGADGRAVYSGTTDIVDDFDCAYVLTTVTDQADTNERIVEFSNLKRRGDVAQTAGYSYALERGLSYDALLLSVRPVDTGRLEPLKQAIAAASDAVVVEAVLACIREGVNTKMRLVDATAQRAGCTRREALRIVERYTGDDPKQHRWRFVVRERGAKVYELLDPAQADAEG